MADAKLGVYASQLKQATISRLLIDGSKFLHWDDESAGAQAVTLKVDPKGHVLYWRDGSGYLDSLEIACIRDTRTGRTAKIPKDSKVKESCAMFGSSEALVEDRTVSVVFGSDLVNVQWQNFVATSKAVAQEWAAQLFSLATNSFVNNPCFYSLLERTWTRLSVSSDAEGFISMKNICKQFASHKDDRKKIEKALASCKLLSAKKDAVEAKQFSMPAFLQFYACLAPRQDIDQLCVEINPACKSKSTPYINIDQFVRFLNDKQRDPRLNEILYPYANEAKAREIIQRFEPDRAFAEKDQLSSQGLHTYLISADNDVIPLEKLDMSQDMDQPLSHYFINSSHNTYLSGHQLTGKSSVELYRQVLLTGCRCIELDCWDGRGPEEEPIITHGFTMCSEVSFRDTMEAIADSAFKTSEFPVILSFENHCSPKQQVKMVKLIKDCLGDRLLSQALESHPLRPGTPLPSPQALRGKFLIKNKKRHFKKGAKQRDTTVDKEPQLMAVAAVAAAAAAAEEPATIIGLDEAHKESAPDSIIVEEFPEEDPDEDPELRKLREAAGEIKEEKQAMTKEPVMLSEISAMVNYIEPAPFYSFEYALKKNVSFECCSVAETNATNLLKESPEEFVNFNKRQISRIYPKGTRVDSSNYMPQLFWNAGCQLVALNFQTPDLGLQLNLGIFHYQKKCGYLLKPEFMRRSDRRFDPFSESTVDGIVANSLSIQVISGYFLSEKRIGTYVEVEMYGLPADTVRKRFRTKTVAANGLNPVFNQEPFVFKKVVLPHLATIRIVVYEESGRMIGQRILPVDSLRPGYRHVPLFSELMQSVSLATLFVYISVNDYVSDAFAELAAALANPIQYLSERDKHQQQLLVLTDDFDVVESADGTGSSGARDPMDLAEPIVSSTNASTSAAAVAAVASSSERSRTPAGDSQQSAASVALAPRPITRGATVRCVGSSGGGGGGGGSGCSAVSELTVGGGGGVAGATGGKPGSPQDTSCVKKLSIEEVMNDKKYQKVLHKCGKEMHSLVKQNQKELSSLHAKFKSAQAKSEHSGNSTKKRLTVVSRRRRNSDEDVNESPSLTEEQKAELRNLLEAQAVSEFELQCKHQTALRSELERALVGAIASAEKSLETIYQQELGILKKTQERQRNLESREITKQYKDKEKLKEVRKEFQRKQISAAVSELQMLDSLHEKRQRELREHNERLRKEAEKHFEEERRRLDKQKSDRVADAETASQIGLYLANTPSTSSAGRSLPGTPSKQPDAATAQ